MNAENTGDIGRSAPGDGEVTSGRQAEEQRSEEDADLRAGLAGLARLTFRLGLEDMLTRVATYAVRAIPGADGAGLTLLEDDRADTIVATAAFVSEIDDIQYGVGQGPCITAAREAQTVISGSLGADPRWRKFGGTVARLGVHSVVSLPLVTPDRVVGAMNVYAHAKHAFDERAAELGEIFAVPAAVAVQNAQVLAQTQRLAAQLSVGVGEARRHRSGDRDHDEPQRRHGGRGDGPAPCTEPEGAPEAGRGGSRNHRRGRPPRPGPSPRLIPQIKAYARRLAAAQLLLIGDHQLWRARSPRACLGVRKWLGVLRQGGRGTGPCP